MTKIAFIIILLLNVQIDWIEKVENKINTINQKGLQIKKSEMEESGVKAILTKFQIDNFNKIEMKYSHRKLMDISSNYYSEDDFIFAQIVTGKDVLIYKREKKENEPSSVLIESRTLFKNENEGIRKSRRIKIYKNDNIEDLKNKLQDKGFETKILNKEDYQKMKEDYLRLKKEK